MTSDYEVVRTDRLLLTSAGLDDLDSMAELHGDPRVWRHFLPAAIAIASRPASI